jgi:hypothetical protein
MTMLKKTILASIIVAVLSPVPALADRAPTADELARLEEVLHAAGYRSWEEIEWDDDGHWEVDDAVDADGREWDLKLDADYAIIERDD